MAQNGLISVPSHHSVKETIDRLQVELGQAGVSIFARIDHSAAAERVDMSLRPTELLIFGDPKAGTPLMVSVQSIGIDLPLKMLAWQDEAGKVWLSYNDPLWLGERHGLPLDQAERLKAMAAGLAAVARNAAAP